MQARVYNDGNFDWEEEYKGQKITIPKGGYVTMARSRAVKFVSQFAPFRREGDERSQNKKKLRIVVDPEEFAKATDQPLKYQALDGTKFRTKAGVEKYESGLAESNGVKPRGRQKPNSN